MPNLSVRDIHTYYGQSHVLQGVSLEVEAGETVALLGRNGAGKTTTFRSIMGLTPPRRGTIEFNGTEIQGAEPYDISRRGIGYVPEERRVFPELTVADNIGVVLDSDSSWSREDLYEIFPKLEELSNSLGQHLSGGEQQMLAIARALATDPSLLILDEPSEGLAPNIVEDLRVNLNSVIEQRDITVLIAEQNAKFAFDVADKASILSKGSVVWDGAIPELEADSELVGKYLSVEEL